MNEIIKRGEYKIIRTDGAEILHTERPFMKTILADIGAVVMDTVILDSRNGQIMVCDDSGMIDGKPVNPKATKLYHAVCRPGTLHQIHGDVAIVNDCDFAH